MTTFQEKIDAIFDKHAFKYSKRTERQDVDIAIHELREHILAISSREYPDDIRYNDKLVEWIRLKDVLALIGADT